MDTLTKLLKGTDVEINGVRPPSKYERLTFNGRLEECSSVLALCENSKTTHKEFLHDIQARQHLLQSVSVQKKWVYIDGALDLMATIHRLSFKNSQKGASNNFETDYVQYVQLMKQSFGDNWQLEISEIGGQRIWQQVVMSNQF